MQRIMRLLLSNVNTVTQYAHSTHIILQYTRAGHRNLNRLDFDWTANICWGSLAISREIILSGEYIFWFYSPHIFFFAIANINSEFVGIFFFTPRGCAVGDAWNEHTNMIYHFRKLYTASTRASSVRTYNTNKWKTFVCILPKIYNILPG